MEADNIYSPCEIVVELLAFLLDVLEDSLDRADDGKDEAAKGNCAQVIDLNNGDLVQ